jgi:hypothetical protein
MVNSDPTDWWYYFEKVDNKEYAQCKLCAWKKPRGKDRSTRLLKNHLEKKHPEQWSKKLEAERLAEKKRFELERKRATTSIPDHFPKLPRLQKDDEKDEDENQTENSQSKNYPIFGNEFPPAR